MTYRDLVWQLLQAQLLILHEPGASGLGEQLAGRLVVLAALGRALLQRHVLRP